MTAVEAGNVCERTYGGMTTIDCFRVALMG